MWYEEETKSEETVGRYLVRVSVQPGTAGATKGTTLKLFALL
jgi:hypothetical protein